MYVQLCIHTFTLAQIHVYAGVCVCASCRAATTATPLRPVGAQSNTHTQHIHSTHTHFIRSSTDCIYQILLQFCCCYSFLYSTIFKQLIAAQPAWTAQQQTRLQLFFLFILCIINLAFVCVVCVVCMCDWICRSRARISLTAWHFAMCYTHTHIHTPRHAYSHANNRSCR